MRVAAWQALASMLLLGVGLGLGPACGARTELHPGSRAAGGAGGDGGAAATTASTTAMATSASTATSVSTATSTSVATSTVTVASSSTAAASSSAASSTASSAMSSSTGIVFDCPSLSFKGHTYLFCQMALIWDAAVAHCKMFGGNLVSLDDAAEDDFVFQGANQFSNQDRKSTRLNSSH